MNDELSENLQNLRDFQSLSRYELVSNDIFLETYFKILNITYLLNEEKYWEIV